MADKTKVCTRCGRKKPLIQFYSWFDKKYNKKRYQSWCQDCVKAPHVPGEKMAIKPKAPKVVRYRVDDVRGAKQRMRERAANRHAQIDQSG